MKPIYRGLATLLGGFLGLSHVAHAQGSYVDDALLYSRQNPAGTARTLGLGGASTSLGSDYGSMNTNPAGLGLYTKSEFTLTPGLGLGSSTSDMVPNAASLASQSLDMSTNRLNIASMGLVFTSRRPTDDQSTPWRGGSFSLGYTRLADFNYGYRYRSLTDDAHSFYQFLREPYGYLPSQTLTAGYQNALIDIDQQARSGSFNNLAGLSYGAYLTAQHEVRDANGNILKDANGNPYYQVVINNPRQGDVQQDGVVKSKGALSQFDIGYGGNYRDKLYIGGAIGIVSMNRTLTSTFGESQDGGTNFYYDDYLKTTGTGINARLGVIVRPTDAIRFGASVQTPTYLQLTDVTYTVLNVNPSYVANQPTQSGYPAPSATVSTPTNSYDYNVTLPFRANGGLTVLAGKYGFLTGDIEYVGYSQTRFNPASDDTSSSFDADNADIRNNYKNTVNLKVGLEGRFSIFRARLGYAHYGNPYTNGTLNRAQNYVTGGLGVRTKSFFIDAAEVVMNTKNQYAPYTLANEAAPVAGLKLQRATTTVTAGFLF